MNRVLPLIIALWIPISPLADNSQAVKWETISPAVAPKLIELPETTEENTSTQESEHLQEIDTLLHKRDLARFKDACEQFIQKYPQSRHRFEIGQLLKKVFGKNLQIYNLFGASIAPGLQPRVKVVGVRVGDLQWQLWHIDLLAMIRAGIDPHLPALLPQFSRKVRSWRMPVPEKPWFSDEIPVPVDKLGFYILTARDKDVFASTFFAVTELALVVKRSENMLLAWVTNYGDGKAVGSCDIFLLNGSKIVYQGKFGQDGIWTARLAPLDGKCTVLAVRGDSIALCDSNWYRYEAPRKRCYLYSNKHVYRPREKLYVKGILRSFNYGRGSYDPPSAERVKLLIRGENWRQVAAQSIDCNAWGTFSFTYPLDKEPPGKYSIIVDGSGYYQRTDFTISEAGSASEIAKTQAIRRNKHEQKQFIITAKRHEHSPEAVHATALSLLKKPLSSLITWENSKILGYCVHPIANTKRRMAMVTSPEFSPYVDVTATTFFDGRLLTASQRVEIPARDKFLTISVSSTGQNKAISVRDADGKPVVAEIFVSITDANAIGDNIDIRRYFYGEAFAATVGESSLSFEYLYDREYAFLPQQQSQHIPREQKTLDSGEGGSSSDFAICYPQLTTTTDGQATFAFTSNPPGDGALRMAIIAIDKQSRVGMWDEVIDRK